MATFNIIFSSLTVGLLSSQIPISSGRIHKQTVWLLSTTCDFSSQSDFPEIYIFIPNWLLYIWVWRTAVEKLIGVLSHNVCMKMNETVDLYMDFYFFNLSNHYWSVSYFQSQIIKLWYVKRFQFLCLWHCVCVCVCVCVCTHIRVHVCCVCGHNMPYHEMQEFMIYKFCNNKRQYFICCNTCVE